MRRILIAAALLAFAPGCESGSDNPDVATIVALSGDATSGESLYGTHCSSCHMADGTGNPGLNYPSLVEHASKETDEEIVAFCDVDWRELGGRSAAEIAKKHPKVPKFTDFREMLERCDEATLRRVRGAVGEIIGGAHARGGARTRIALIGLRGAGKSTLGKAAMGYTQPGCKLTGGSIIFDGIDLAKAGGPRWIEVRSPIGRPGIRLAGARAL